MRLAARRNPEAQPKDPKEEVSGESVERVLVDLVGIEPTTSSMPWKRAPSCATGPRWDESILADGAKIVNRSSSGPSLIHEHFHQETWNLLPPFTSSSVEKFAR